MFFVALLIILAAGFALTLFCTWLLGVLEILLFYRLCDAPAIALYLRWQNGASIIVLFLGILGMVVCAFLSATFVTETTTWIGQVVPLLVDLSANDSLFWGGLPVVFVGLSLGTVMGSRLVCWMSVRARMVQVKDLVPLLGGK